MGRKYFLGLAAGRKGALRQLFLHGRKKDMIELKQLLEARYDGEAMLCKNGRSALALALKANFKRGEAIIVNGFTCFAVYEAVKAAGLEAVFADITREDLNFGVSELTAAIRRAKATGCEVRGVIIQNTLGNPAKIVEIEEIAAAQGLVIIEDLAHSVGISYADGREAGTVGAATVLSFGKEKAIDATSGGAVVFRNEPQRRPSAPAGRPRLCEYLRERWYPTFAATARGLTRVRLGGVLMWGLVKLKFVERSADSRLDLTRRLPRFEARLALEQLRRLESEQEPLREFHLVRDRAQCLAELKQAGYYFDGFWYERPVSPERYYKKVHFDEAACPVATEVAREIVNLPKYYKKSNLAVARKIIKKYEETK